MIKTHWAILIFLLLFGVVATKVLAGRNSEVASVYYFESAKEQQLEQAIKDNNLTAVQIALQSGAKVNARGKFNITPLMIAVDYLHLDIAKTLLQAGADPNLKADDKNSAVSLAVKSYKTMPEMMQLIFQNKGDPNLRGTSDAPMLLYFIDRTDCQAIRYMHSIGADINVQTDITDGHPLILNAALASDWDVVWCLLELGAKFDYKNEQGRYLISEDVNINKFHSDSPLFPYKKKVWIYLKEHGVHDLIPLFDDPDHLGAETK